MTTIDPEPQESPATEQWARELLAELKGEDSTGQVALLAEALLAAQNQSRFTAPGSVRVVRLLEYVYPDAKAALDDQQHWQVQGVYRPSAGRLIRSTILPIEVRG
jgi:hypothetical protein